MCIMSSPVIILEGIVWYKDSSVHIGDNLVLTSIEPYLNKVVTLSVHHWPDKWNAYCYLNGTCEVHNRNPKFLFSWKRKGILGEDFTVNKEQIPIDDLIGHHCRIVLLLEDFTVPQSTEDIINDAQQLTELLESLRQSLEELK